MDIGNVFLHILIKFPWVLPRVTFLGTIFCKNWVSCIINQFQTRERINKFKGVLPTHSTVVHTVFMDHGDTFGSKRIKNEFKAFNSFFCHEFDTFNHFIAHNPDKFCSESFHPWNGTVDLCLGDGKVVPYIFSPIRNGGSECINMNSTSIKCFADLVKGILG